MRIRKYLKVAKPSIKGSIMVLFGIFISRMGISVEFFTINIIYGPLAYLFIAFSGIMVIKFLQIINTHSYDDKISKKRTLIFFGVLYLIGFILIVGNVIDNSTIYYFNIPILIFTAIIGILWCFFGYFGFKSRKNINNINILIETLTFSIGLIYGAFLNTFLIPIFLYFFFVSISFLQLSRELLKGFEDIGKNQNYEHDKSRNINKKSFKLSLIFQILVLLFLVFSIFYNIINSALILLLMIFNLITLGFAFFLTLASIIEKEIYKKIALVLKIGIFLEMFLLLVLGS